MGVRTGQGGGEGADAGMPELAPGPDGKAPRIAVVHDWLLQYGGAEAVLKAILTRFPQADLFSVCDFLSDSERKLLGASSTGSTFIQKLPGARRWARYYLPLMPLAVEQLALARYDIVISNSHAVANGVLTGPEQLHLAYVHSPMRYAWDMQHEYLRESGLDRGLRGLGARLALHYMRLWDARTAAGVDAFAANSAHVARRIRKCYRRAAQIIYPPVDLGEWSGTARKEPYYIVVSRLAPYKRVPAIVAAFAGTRRRLVVVGDGPDMRQVKKRAKGAPNVEILGRQPRERVVGLIGGARALVHMALEDFGMVMVEALASGTPVIAYGRGGAREIVASGRTGYLFYDQSIQGLRKALDAYEALGELDSVVCRRSVERFSKSAFLDGFGRFVERHWQDYAAQLAAQN